MTATIARNNPLQDGHIVSGNKLSMDVQEERLQVYEKGKVIYMCHWDGVKEVYIDDKEPCNRGIQ